MPQEHEQHCTVYIRRVSVLNYADVCKPNVRGFIRGSRCHVWPLQAYVIEQSHMKHDMGKWANLEVLAHIH